MALSIVRLPAVMAQVGLSRSTIYLRISERKFPRSISLGGRAVGWVQSDIQGWLEQCLAESRVEEVVA